MPNGQVLANGHATALGWSKQAFLQTDSDQGEFDERAEISSLTREISFRRCRSEYNTVALLAFRSK